MNQDVAGRRQHARAAVKLFTPGRLIGAGLALACVAFVLWVLPSSEYIFLPDVAHPVAPLVTVPEYRSARALLN